jgi:uncharacterized protein YbjT (DUF2867 family)
MRRVLLIGGSGLVGAALADRLLDDGAEVEALLRRPSGRRAAGWREHVAPAEDWGRIAAGLGGDAAVSALGTTMRAAGSQAAFAAVDRDLVLDFARAARAAGIAHFITVSSVGAHPAARAFYLRLKGEVEEELKRLGFARLDIVRPGLLRGERGSERRPGERLAILLSPATDLVLRGPLARYAAIDATAVAGAIARLTRDSSPGTFVHHNRDLAGT